MNKYLEIGIYIIGFIAFVLVLILLGEVKSEKMKLGTEFCNDKGYEKYRFKDNNGGANLYECYRTNQEGFIEYSQEFDLNKLMEKENE